jgi:hypothetical protein
LYELTDIVSEPITPSREGVTRTFDLTTPGQVAKLRVDGTAGQRLAVKTTASTVTSGYLRWKSRQQRDMGRAEYVR